MAANPGRRRWAPRRGHTPGSVPNGRTARAPAGTWTGSAPAPGDWLYFVTIDMQGTTLFTRDYEQHLANIELATRNGVLDSAR